MYAYVWLSVCARLMATLARSLSLENGKLPQSLSCKNLHMMIDGLVTYQREREERRRRRRVNTGTYRV